MLTRLITLYAQLRPQPAPAPQAPQAPARPGLLFLSGRAAGSVLRRQRRHNTGMFEEFYQGDLERECVEERCDLEEAREVFEDDQKTVRASCESRLGVRGKLCGSPVDAFVLLRL